MKANSVNIPPCDKNTVAFPHTAAGNYQVNNAIAVGLTRHSKAMKGLAKV